ncbi:MAG: anaerobic ribonucleoside-triphosphate reductase [Treponema sp.]|jgi:ribonucleoside-triphosphate reductase|nr:anaerobic ribonucleoside-triphosphate reductase [Treponema sp.]
MRNLEVIEKELAAAREALSQVTGTPAEVYSRIVGYYRSVRNWNKGKREEYGERLMFNPSCAPRQISRSAPRKTAPEGGLSRESAPRPGGQAKPDTAVAENAELARVLLFVRPACPACPPAKAAAGKLGLPVDLVNADTDEGLAEAVRRSVMSTPTAILLSRNGEELARARDPDSIGRLLAG